jgi:hypothetical protein
MLPQAVLLQLSQRKSVELSTDPNHGLTAHLE